MKNISLDLQNHLREETTTLATLWRLQRTDGVQYFFTDHDRDIFFDGNRYLASSGYTRTATAASANMSVNNTDIEGVFDNSAISEEDLRNGKFDFCNVKMSIVNWQNITQGELRVSNGRLGEVTITSQGFSAPSCAACINN